MIDKNILRKKYRNVRSNILDKSQKEEIIRKKVIDYIKRNNAKIIGIYASFKDEVDTFLLIQELNNIGINTVLPRIHNNKSMDFYYFTSINELEKNDFGILEPKKENKIVTPEDIDVIIVPGLVFDTKKNRIGYGKGYYDRYLKNINAHKIGICFDEQIIEEEIENEIYDVKMDLIISDKREI